MRAVLFIVKEKESEEEIGNVPEIDLKAINVKTGRRGFQARSRGISKLWNDGNGNRYTIDLKLVEAVSCPQCGKRGYLRERKKSKDRVCIRCGWIGK